MTLIDRLDSAAKKTGIPAAAMRKPQRRRMRWLPIFALLIGMGAWIAVVARPWSPIVPSIVLTMTLSLAGWFQTAGPLKTAGGTEAFDEFDRQRMLRSNLFGLGCAAFFGFVGMLILGGLTLMLGWTRDMLLVSMLTTGMMMPLIWLAVPTLHASWTMEPLDEED